MSNAPQSPRSPKLLFAILIIGLVAIAVLTLPMREWLSQLLKSVESLGPWGPLAFVVIYIIATVLFVPGSLLTLGAGAAWGVAKGTLVVSIAAILGATAAFLVGRYLARDWVARKIVGNDRFQAIDQAVAREGWKIVMLTRLSPAFPFNLLNYALGLTRISLRDYIIASYFGMLPGTILYVYLGTLIGETTKQPTAAQWTLRGIGLVATIVVTIFIARIARRALDEKVSDTNVDPLRTQP